MARTEAERGMTQQQAYSLLRRIRRQREYPIQMAQPDRWMERTGPWQGYYAYKVQIVALAGNGIDDASATFYAANEWDDWKAARRTERQNENEN